MTQRHALHAYDALHDDAAIVDRSDRLRMLFHGEKAKETLGGLVTNDVTSLKRGESLSAAALTPKGRLIALLRVVDRGDALLVDTEAASGEGFVAMIRKFVNPRLAKYEIVSEAIGCLGVYGPEAVARLTPLLVPGDLTAPSDDFGVPGVDLFAPQARLSELRTALEASLPVADATTLEIARVEAGRPRFGIDMDGETIPQEANLDQLGAISFTKGCYTGQEVVARIHFRGHVNRHLRRLVAATPLVRGSEVLDSSGKVVGSVRSAVVSPRRGPLALAMIRREVEPGSSVRVKADGAEVEARVEVLTSPDDARSPDAQRGQ